MESDDDMHDANDLASAEEEDDYYSGGEEEVDDYNYSYDEAEDEDEENIEDFEFMANESDDVPVSRLQKNYTVLTDEDIRQRQEEDITRISTVLLISRDAACILLRRYKWSVNDVHEEWFSDEERVRKAVGILEKPLVQFSNAKEVTCGICFENYSLERICTAVCGHPFCDSCWKAYISTSINDGPGCLTLRCPDPSCGAAIGQDMINMLAPDGDKEKYCRYLLRSYVEDSRKSRQKASVDLHQMQSVHLEKLSEVQTQPESQMKFIIEAWQQIVECRKVLKWTYAYGYYLPEHEHTKKQFFEYLQGEAEAGLERLHQCAEKELQNYLNAEGPSKDFNDFRTKLAGLTSVTRNYFENLVRALENGLSDVDPRGSCSKMTSSKNVAGSSKAKGGRAKGSSRTGALSRNTDDSSSWACDQCTFMNARSSTKCHMCHYHR
ncbi:unnamed protein product [Fraxinus pennsylvanica]|uniref:RBR-type E3 ubiquitin transferase n=1 Tax=Fraxinus pennsylvanica TaxID=56036 RepID=A0AAD2DS46_9LAMI|nr:unnamed protein product [Fraxinus pennsylvanica]